MIALLDQNTINKIAAGEVVERPASVVKELVENSIDAKATAITVEIKDGGISYIRITDNGIGIAKSELETAFLRHSTSKIKNVEDLMSVHSLGFRGEALASIASVSQVEIITKTYDDLTGARYIIEGGVGGEIEEIGCPEGTTIIIRNLFYNTPARRKFLKKPATEAGYVSEYVNKLALGNPGVSFKFINNNGVKLHTSGNSRLKDCIFNVYGKDIAKNIIPINLHDENFAVEGYIGKPQISRANRNYENYYINGRWIKSKVIQKAIEDGYKSFLTVHKYPFTMFNISIKQEMIDVNVHPTKMEIRFDNEVQLYEGIKADIIKVLNEIDLIPEVSLEPKKRETIKYDSKIPEPFETNRINKMKETIVKEEEAIYPKKEIKNVNDDKTITIEKKQPIVTSSPSLEVSTIPAAKEVNTISTIKIEDKNEPVKPIQSTQIEIDTSSFISKDMKKNHKIVGQLFQTYWIVEFSEKYYLIDQHAAHERVLYERILKQISEENVISQPLLHPVIINLSMKEMQIVNEYQQVFIDLGFEIENFGGDSIAIRSVPYIFDKPMQSDYFIEILDTLSESYSKKHQDRVLEEVASKACKAAVKAHDKMSVMEYEKLIDELLALENPYTCPHGRPTIISMTRYELEKKFKRIQ